MCAHICCCYGYSILYGNPDKLNVLNEHSVLD